MTNSCLNDIDEYFRILICLKFVTAKLNVALTYISQISNAGGKI